MDATFITSLTCVSSLNPTGCCGWNGHEWKQREYAQRPREPAGTLERGSVSIRVRLVIVHEVLDIRRQVIVNM